MPEEELDQLEAYVEQVNLYPGSGEFALVELFQEGIYAVRPLHDRIRNTPVLFMYGDRDWMDRKGAPMNAENNSCQTICEIVSESGHHLYLDNPSEFAEKMVEGLRRL